MTTPLSIDASDDDLRREFHKLKAEIDGLLDNHDNDPALAAYEKKRNEILKIEREELAPLKTKVKELRKGLYEKQNRLARLKRMLNGETALPEHKERAAKAAAEADAAN